MKKTFLLVCFLFLLAGLNAQQPKTKSPDVIEYKEGGNPALKAQQKQVKNETQAVPKPLDSVRSSTKNIKDVRNVSKSTANPTVSARRTNVQNAHDRYDLDSTYSQYKPLLNADTAKKARPKLAASPVKQ